jgi:hypothetical protein
MYCTDTFKTLLVLLALADQHVGGFGEDACLYGGKELRRASREGISGISGMASYIINVDNKRRGVALHIQAPWYALGRPKGRPKPFGEEKPLPLLGIKLTFL